MGVVFSYHDVMEGNWMFPLSVKPESVDSELDSFDSFDVDRGSSGPP